MNGFWRELAFEYATDLKMRIESGEITHSYIAPADTFGYDPNKHIVNKLFVQTMIEDQEKLYNEIYLKGGMKLLDLFIETQKEHLEKEKENKV